MYRFLHGSHLHIPPGVDKNEENMRQILSHLDVIPSNISKRVSMWESSRFTFFLCGPVAQPTTIGGPSEAQVSWLLSGGSLKMEQKSQDLSVGSRDGQVPQCCSQI